MSQLLAHRLESSRFELIDATKRFTQLLSKGVVQIETSKGVCKIGGTLPWEIFDTVLNSTSSLLQIIRGLGNLTLRFLTSTPLIR